MEALWELIIVQLPGPSGVRLRREYWGKRFRHMGRNVKIDTGVQILNPEWITVGDDCLIDKNVILMAGPVRDGGRKVTRRPNPNFKHEEGELVLGHGVHLAKNTVVSGHGGVYIGDYSCVATGGHVYSVSHHYRNLGDPSDTYFYKTNNAAPDEEQTLVVGPVVIEENTGVAALGIVMVGVTVGHDSYPVAYSLVMEDVPPYAISRGQPAKPVKLRPGAPEEASLDGGE